MATAALYGLGTILALAFGTWIVSIVKHDVSIVDSVWSLLILLAAFTYAIALPEVGPRAPWILALAALWAARLAGYITWRNWGEPEDYRYQAIRARNQPGFALKSIYLIFGLQGYWPRSCRCLCSAPWLARGRRTGSTQRVSSSASSDSFSRRSATGSSRASSPTRPTAVG